MKAERWMGLWVLAAVAAGCGDEATPGGPGSGYDLPRQSPYPETLMQGESVRRLVLRYEDRVSIDGRGTQCSAASLTFDVTTVTPNAPAAIDNANGCRLYTRAPEVDYPAQRQLCVGAYSIASGTLNETFTFCPQPGARTVTWQQNLSGCGSFVSSRSAQVTSLDEGVEGDAVTDLSAQVLFPSAVTITGPTNLAIATWPADGDLTVTWEASDATSALVRVEEATVGDPAASPVIVCNPTRQGRVVVSQALIAQANFRGREARVRVWSFRDRDVQAGGATWRVTGATGTNLTLQARR